MSRRTNERVVEDIVRANYKPGDTFDDLELIGLIWDTPVYTTPQSPKKRQRNLDKRYMNYILNKLPCIKWLENKPYKDKYNGKIKSKNMYVMLDEEGKDVRDIEGIQEE